MARFRPVAMKVLGAALLAVSAVAVAVTSATGAQASTTGCTSGAYYAYCGTQADNGSPVLVIDSQGQADATNNPIIGWPDSASDPGTDFFQLAYERNAFKGVMFMFAPGGILSNMCAADPGNGKVVLRPCNGSDWQRWVATEVGNTGYSTWANLATNRILQAGAKGAQLVTVASPTTPLGTQQWTFTPPEVIPIL
jgi:hypothetical protein